MKQVTFLFIGLFISVSIFSCSSDDDNKKEDKEMPVTSLSEISGSWVLDRIERKNGDIFREDCDFSFGLINIDSNSKEIFKRTPLSGVNTGSVCGVTEYNYENVKFTYISNMECVFYPNSLSTYYHRYSVTTKGDFLLLSVYQVEMKSGNQNPIISTFELDRQITYYYKRE